MQRAEPIVLAGYLPNTATEMLAVHSQHVWLWQKALWIMAVMSSWCPSPTPNYIPASAKGCEYLGRCWVWDAPYEN